MYYQFAFRASQALALLENRRPKRSSSLTMMFAVAVLAATLNAVPAAADVIYGTSGTSSNISAYNTQTQTTSTIPTDLNSPYGIAYNPSNGDLYVVDANPAESTEKIEIYSTSGTDLGTFASGLTFNTLTGGLTFDKSGNLYVVTGSSVEEFLAGGGTAMLPGTFSFPAQLAVDNSNNLFVTDIGNDTVDEYGPARTIQTVFAIQNPAGVGGVAADAAGNVYVSTDSSFDIFSYASGGGAPTGNPYSNVGAFGLVYSPGTNSLFGADAPSLNQYNLSNSNPSTNWSQVSGGFAGTAYLTVQPVPEPASGVLLSLGVLLLARKVRRKRRGHQAC